MSREFLPARVVCGPQNVGGESKGSVEHGEWLNLGHEIWSREAGL